MMALWTKILRHGSKITNSQLVFASQKALHQCSRQKTLNLVNSVHFPKQCKFLCATSSSSPNSSSHPNCRSVSSTTPIIENSDKGGLSDNNSGDGAPVEWSGEQEECTLILSDAEIQELSGGDPEIIKKIRYIQLEHEICRQEGNMVPMERLSVLRWEELLACHSKAKRMRTYEYLFKIEKKKANDTAKKEVDRQQRMERFLMEGRLPLLDEDADGMSYGLNKNTLFLRLYDTSMNQFYYTRLVQEMMFGQPFVLDCGLSQYMSLPEAKSCSKQLEYVFTENREHSHPFDLHFVNVDQNDDVIKYLNRKMPQLLRSDVPINVTSKNYLDLFPREKLVYITPYANEELLKFDHDAIYIMGCIVDKSCQKPVTAAKAKRENIRMQKLPLDRYLDWGLGNKSLPFNQIINIMLDQRKYNDWNKSLVHVPKRKLRGGRDGYRDREQEDNFGAPTRRDGEYSNFPRNGHRIGEIMPIRDYGRSINDRGNNGEPSDNSRYENNRHAVGSGSYRSSNDSYYSRNREFRGGNYSTPRSNYNFDNDSNRNRDFKGGNYYPSPRSNDNFDSNNRNRDFRRGSYSIPRSNDNFDSNTRNRDFRGGNYSIPRSNDYFDNNNRNRDFRRESSQERGPRRKINVRSILSDPDT